MAIFEKKSNSFYEIDNTDRIAVHMNDIEIKNRYHRLNDCCSLDDTKLEIIKCAWVAYMLCRTRNFIVRYTAGNHGMCRFLCRLD